MAKPFCFLKFCGQLPGGKARTADQEEAFLYPSLFANALKSTIIFARLRLGLQKNMSESLRKMER